MSNAIHAYISQSDKGDLVIGAGIDAYTGYGQRGSYQTIEHTLQAIVEMFPIFSRVRMNRQWGGIVDVSPDACPIIGLTRSRACTSTAAGAPAASRPHPARAGSWRTPWRRTARTELNAAFSPRALLHRPPDRRARRGRRGSLRRAFHAGNPMPLVRPRAEVEFAYGGEGGIARPKEPEQLTDEEWGDYVFMRDNPKGLHHEQWRHASGCRRWFNALRDTVTYRITPPGRSASPCLS
jgi:heterotetrameric sarcosine oxidase delta subunit